MHGGEIEPVVGPAEQLLSFRIDELGEEDPVKRGVLADEDRLFPPDVELGKAVDDLLRGLAGSLAFGDLFPGETIDPEALLIAPLPGVDRRGDEGVKAPPLFSCGEVDSGERYLEDLVNAGVEAVGFGI